jgi:hypothetical protein
LKNEKQHKNAAAGGFAAVARSFIWVKGEFEM